MTVYFLINNNSSLKSGTYGPFATEEAARCAMHLLIAEWRWNQAHFDRYFTIESAEVIE